MTNDRRAARPARVVPLLLALLAGCAEEPGPRLGGTCGDDSECESGVCRDGICVDPSTLDDADTSGGDVADTTTPDVDPATTPDVDATTTPEVDATPPEPEVVPVAVVSAWPAEVTNAAAVRFEFTSDPPGATFVCVVDDGAPTPCSSPLELALAEGPHTLDLIAQASDGRPDPAPPRFAWRVDRTPPAISITGAPPAIDNSVDVTFVFGADEAATFECRHDAGAWAACASPWALVGLADGPHTAAVRATDLAGNLAAAPAEHAWTLDTTTPDTSLAGPSGTVALATAKLTFKSTAVGATFTCALDGAAPAACTSPLVLEDLADGAHVAVVAATSAAGVVDPTPAELRWIVDTVAPTATITKGPAALGSDATPSFAFEVAGAPALVECRVDLRPFEDCTDEYQSPPLPDGAHTFEVVVTDLAGNEGSATRDFTIDTQAPAVGFAAGPVGATNDATPTFVFSLGADAVTTQCRLDGGAWLACASPHTFAPLADGVHTLQVRAADALGNSAMVSRVFVVDTAAPALTITGGPANGSLLANQSTVAFTFTTSGADTVECRLYVTGQAAPAYTSCTSPFTRAIGFHGYTFQVRATDDAGNGRTITRTFTNASVG